MSAHQLLDPEVLKVLGVPTAGALLLAGMLLWRFERIVRQHREEGREAREAFLQAMKEEGERHERFLANHLGPMTEAFGDVCGEMKGLAAIISDCAARRRE